MKELSTFNVELNEFAAQVIVWIGRSDDGQELCHCLITELIREKLPEDQDTGGLTRDEYVFALASRFDSAISDIQVALFESRKEAA